MHIDKYIPGMVKLNCKNILYARGGVLARRKFMKRKLLLTFVMVIAFALTFALVVFADTIHNENTVDYSETVTLSDGTVLPIFDENKEALIWYISGTDSETGKNIYTSIRSDDPQVIYHCESWFEITSTRIDLSDGTKISSSNFVVVNWMDDDVVVNECTNASFIGKGVTGFKLMFQGNKNLEYIFLRHDTTSIMRQNFNGCSKLQYVNFKDLANVTRIGDSQNFSNCTPLFRGQILDLSGMVKLERIDGGGSFNGLQVTGVKFPSSIKVISSWTFQATAIESISWPTTVTTMEGSMFKNNTALKEICLSNTLTKIDSDAFLNVKTLEKIFFVGTKSELETLIANTNATGNDYFLAVAGENNANIISYADYLALEDKSGKYAIYDYSYCEGYKEGVHAPNEKSDDCTKILCDDCTLTLKGLEAHAIVDKVVYENGFAKDGVYHYYCTNERCTVIDKEDETKAPIFSASGYSTNAEGNAITGGYTVDFGALDFFKSKNGNLRYGIIIANANSFDGEVLDGDFKVTSQKAIQVEIDSNYANFNCSINYGANTGANLELVITAYAIDAEGNVTFIQADSVYAENATIGSNILKKITLAKVVANQPTKSDDE